MTPMHYKNAELNIQALQSELTKAGLLVDARRLVGIEVSDKGTAQVAIDIVQNLSLANGHTPQGVLAVKDWTIHQLVSAMNTSTV